MAPKAKSPQAVEELRAEILAALPQLCVEQLLDLDLLLEMLLAEEVESPGRDVASPRKED